MRTLRWILIWPVLVAVVVASARASPTSVAVMISAPVAGPGVEEVSSHYTVSVDGAVVSIAPSVVEILNDGTAHSIAIQGTSETGSVVFKITVTAGVVSLGSAVPNCISYSAALIQSPVQGMQDTVKIAVRLITLPNPHRCGSSLSTGIPTNQAKLRFDASVAATALQYREGTGVVPAAAPAVLVVNYYDTSSADAFFKHVGYFDCNKHLTYHQKGDKSWVVIDGKRRIDLQGMVDATAPTISCGMKKAP